METANADYDNNKQFAELNIIAGVKVITIVGVINK